MSRRSLRTVAAAASFLLLASVSAHADCKTTAGDTCLVGTWEQTGGGPAEWMREHMKTVAQLNVTATKALFTFNTDGTFSTSKVDSKAEVTAKDGQIQVTGQMSSQASGQWSAAGGKLSLCNTALDSKGSMQLKMPGGKMMDMPMPETKPSDVTMGYTCAGDTLSTVQTMPMMGEMTTTYTRVP